MSSHEDWSISTAPRLHVWFIGRREEGNVLGVGIDWAEDANQVALGRVGEGVIEEFSVPHRPEAVNRLIERIGALEPDPAEVGVAIETKHGHLVEALVEAGYAVVPVNPDLVARRRGPARKKDDGEDARILCLLALDRHGVLRPLIPHGEAAAELRAIARDDERASGDERRLLKRFPTVEEAQAVPDGEIYLSFPGLGARFAARVAGEIGDHPEQFSSPNSLQCYGGKAPVTRRSGKSEFVVSCRLACNRQLAKGVHQWAFCSLRSSVWAREFYDSQRARGKGHHAALRALGNRWLEVLWHCLRKGVRYDEAIHVENRRRAMAAAA